MQVLSRLKLCFGGSDMPAQRSGSQPFCTIDEELFGEETGRKMEA